jgi:uncharacterized membrane protein
MIFCILTLIGTGLAIYLLTISQHPGLDSVSDALLPLNYGYARMFHSTGRRVTWLAIPATFATGFGFMFSYGRQMSSMARSGLFPKAFKRTTKFSNTPYVSLFVGTFISLLIVIFSEYIIPSLQSELFYLCCLASYLVYINAFIGYIIFSTKYTSVARHFRNPLGIPSAVYGIICFSVAFISVIGFQDGGYVPIVLFVVVLMLLSIYYYCCVMSTQQFSEEEQKALFTAYIINANVRMKKQKKNKKKRIGSRVSNNNSSNLDSRSSPASEYSSSSRSQDYDGRGGDSFHSSGYERPCIEEGIGEEEEEDEEVQGSEIRSEIGGLGQHVAHQFRKQQSTRHRHDSVYSQSSINISEHTDASQTTGNSNPASGTLRSLLDRGSSMHTDGLSTHRSGNTSGNNSGRISGNSGIVQNTTEGTSLGATPNTQTIPPTNNTLEETTQSAQTSSSTTLFTAAIQQLFPAGFKMRGSISSTTPTVPPPEESSSARISARISGRYFGTGKGSMRVSNLAMPEEERVSSSIRVKPIPVVHPPSSAQYMPVEDIENCSPRLSSPQHSQVLTSNISGSGSIRHASEEVEEKKGHVAFPISPILLYAVNSSGTMMTSTGTMHPVSSTPTSPTATNTTTNTANASSSSLMHPPSVLAQARGNSSTNIATLQPILETILHRSQSPVSSVGSSTSHSPPQAHPIVPVASEVSPQSIKTHSIPVISEDMTTPIIHTLEEADIETGKEG